MSIQGRNEIARWVGPVLVIAAVTAPHSVSAQSCTGLRGRSVPFTTVERSVQGPYSQSALLFARDETEWGTGINDLAAAGGLASFPVDAPQVDWKREAVVLVAMGECPTYGYDIRIDAISQEGRKAVISVSYATPTGDLQIQSITSPFHLVCFDKTGISEVEICYSGASLGLSQPAVLTTAVDSDNSASTHVSWSDLKTRY
jgi:hypothetical protein